MIGDTRTNTERKKAFDSTVCFSFFGTWLEAIEEFETETDAASDAYMLFKAIAHYSMYGNEPEFKNKGLNAIWRVISLEIDNSIDRRKRNFDKEEVTEREQTVLDAVAKSPTASMRDIAAATGIHRSSVERIQRKYCRQLEELRHAASAADNGDCASSGIQDVASDCSDIHDIASDCSDIHSTVYSTGTDTSETRQRDTAGGTVFGCDGEDVKGSRNMFEQPMDDDNLPF